MGDLLNVIHRSRGTRSTSRERWEFQLLGHDALGGNREHSSSVSWGCVSIFRGELMVKPRTPDLGFENRSCFVLKSQPWSSAIRRTDPISISTELHDFRRKNGRWKCSIRSNCTNQWKSSCRNGGAFCAVRGLFRNERRTGAPSMGPRTGVHVEPRRSVVAHISSVSSWDKPRMSTSAACCCGGVNG